MENQTDTSPVQAPSQAPVPPSTNWLRIALFTIMGLIIIAGTLIVGIKIGKNKLINLQTAEVEPVATPIEIKYPELTDPLEYINEGWSISFKYPKTWLVIENPENITVCPKDYATNEADAEECFTITKETRSLVGYFSDLEQQLGQIIYLKKSGFRGSAYTGNIIYWQFWQAREGGFSHSYMRNRIGNFVVISATPWDDYYYHFEPYVLDTFQPLNSSN